MAADAERDTLRRDGDVRTSIVVVPQDLRHIDQPFTRRGPARKRMKLPRTVAM